MTNLITKIVMALTHKRPFADFVFISGICDWRWRIQFDSVLTCSKPSHHDGYTASNQLIRWMENVKRSSFLS